MNKKILVGICLKWAVCSSVALAQPFSHHALKANLNPLRQSGFGGAYEWRINEKRGLELSGTWRDKTLPEGAFNGDRIVYFFERRVDSARVGSSESLNDPQWRYLGTGRRLASLPPFIPQKTIQGQLGYRFSFQGECSPWLFYLQPGVTLAWHRYLAINETRSITLETIQEVKTDNTPSLSIITETLGQQQIRQMRLHDVWIPGLIYSVGSVRHLWRGLFLEGRIGGGLNSFTRYKQGLPNSLRGAYVQAYLQIGCSF